MKTLVLLLVVFLSACSTKPFTPPTVCDGQKSVILDTVPDVMALSKGLLLVNLVALEKIPGYTAAVAEELLNEIEAGLQGLNSYAALVVYLQDKVRIANALAGGVILILGDDIDLLSKPLPITDCDIQLIKQHLAKQRMLVAMYHKG